jgi:hypothetical protein
LHDQAADKCSYRFKKFMRGDAKLGGSFQESCNIFSLGLRVSSGQSRSWETAKLTQTNGMADFL